MMRGKWWFVAGKICSRFRGALVRMAPALLSVSLACSSAKEDSDSAARPSATDGGADQGPSGTAGEGTDSAGAGTDSTGGGAPPDCEGQMSAGGACSATVVFTLSGDPDAAALDAIPDVAPVRAAPDDIANGLLLTRLSVVLTRDATIAQFNAASALVGATGLASSRPGSTGLTLVVPRQANGEELERLADGLQGRPGILAAVAGREATRNQLPEQNASSVVLDDLGHLLATGFPAAWNASGRAKKDCGSRKVSVLVPDTYAREPFDFRTQLPGVVQNFSEPAGPPAPGSEIGHGYQAIGMVAGRFDLAPPQGANPFPECLEILPVIDDGLDIGAIVDKVRRAIEDWESRATSGDKLIVSSSQGFPVLQCGAEKERECKAEDLDELLTQRLRNQLAVNVNAAIDWAAFAMARQRPDNLLLVNAAGNERRLALSGLYPGLKSAALVGPFTLATQLGRLDSILGDSALWSASDRMHPSLLPDAVTTTELLKSVAARVRSPIAARNIVTIGATSNARTANELVQTAFSNDGPDLYMVGVDVSGLGTERVSGTSIAAPQVAGLASYLWLLDDRLRKGPTAETLDLIRSTSRSNAKIGGIVDAYQAVLALDKPGDAAPAVRAALLDVNDDGNFDHLDLLQFVQAYDLENPDRPPFPASRDYSRFDLNGDGMTGGIGIAPFELDLSPQAGSSGATLTIEGQEVRMNEAALSDLQILCYYAYSDLYAANASNRDEAMEERTALLGLKQCVGLNMDVTFPAGIGDEAPLEVLLTVPKDGELVPAPGVRVTLAGSCATVTPAEGKTNDAGKVSATVTPLPNCKAVDVELTALSDSGEALATTTAHAVVGAANGSIVLADFPTTPFVLKEGYTVDLPVGATENPGNVPLQVARAFFVLGTTQVSVCSAERMSADGLLLTINVASEEKLKPGTYPYAHWQQSGLEPGTFFPFFTRVTACVAKDDPSTNLTGGELVLTETDGILTGSVTLTRQANVPPSTATLTTPLCSKSLEQHRAISAGSLACTVPP